MNTINPNTYSTAQIGRRTESTSLTTMLQILGAMITSFLGIGIVAGTMAALGLMEQLSDDYVTRMLGNAALGVVVTILLLLYASTLGRAPLPAFAFTWNARDTLFTAATAVMTLALACGYMLLLDTTGAHPVAWAAPSWAAITIGLLGHSGVLHEEVLARGYILMVMERRAGAGRAILISALCFVVLHIPVRGISSMAVSWLLGGLLYGYLYVKSGSLLVTLATHVLHNIVGDLFLYSSNGVSLLRFATPLSGMEKIGFKLILTLLLLGLTSLVYGRGASFLEPSRKLSERWARMADKQELEAQPMPA